MSHYQVLVRLGISSSKRKQHCPIKLHVSILTWLLGMVVFNDQHDESDAHLGPSKFGRSVLCSILRGCSLHYSRAHISKATCGLPVHSPFPFPFPPTMPGHSRSDTALIYGLSASEVEKLATACVEAKAKAYCTSYISSQNRPATCRVMNYRECEMLLLTV